MEVKIIPYEPVHAYDILERNIRECDVQLTGYPDWEQWVENWKTGGPAYTLVIDGQIVGCAGVMLLKWGRGEAWTLLSGLLYQYPKTCFKAVRDGLKGIIRDEGLTRVQALVRPDFEEGKRFMSHLGFKEEGILAAYGPGGEDVIMFGRVP